MNNKAEIYYPKDTMLNVFTKPNKYLKNSHARVFLEEMIALGTDKELSGNDYRVLLAILGNLGYDNKISISQQQLGNQLNIHQARISKSVKKLISKGYVQVIETIGRQNIYQFNPNVAFRSRAKNLKELKHAWDKQTLPKTQKYPIDTDTDLEPDLEDKLDDKVEELSQQFDIPQSKVRQMILSLVNQALTSDYENVELPY